MIGRNSGIRSIGQSTQTKAMTTATLARCGTRGSRRSLRAVVAHAGSTVARSLAAPSGSRRASTTISAHVATSTPPAVLATRKFRNVLAGNREVALVVDDVVSFEPFIARGIRVYGRADDPVERDGMVGPGHHMRITPDRLLELEHGRRPGR